MIKNCPEVNPVLQVTPAMYYQPNPCQMKFVPPEHSGADHYSTEYASRQGSGSTPPAPAAASTPPAPAPPMNATGDGAGPPEVPEWMQTYMAGTSQALQSMATNMQALMGQVAQLNQVVATQASRLSQLDQASHGPCQEQLQPQPAPTQPPRPPSMSVTQEPNTTTTIQEPQASDDLVQQEVYTEPAPQEAALQEPAPQSGNDYVDSLLATRRRAAGATAIRETIGDAPLLPPAEVAPAMQAAVVPAGSNTSQLASQDPATFASVATAAREPEQAAAAEVVPSIFDAATGPEPVVEEDEDGDLGPQLYREYARDTHAGGRAMF